MLNKLMIAFLLATINITNVVEVISMRKPNEVNEELGSNFKSFMSSKLLDGARLAANGKLDEACDLIAHYFQDHGSSINSEKVKTELNVYHQSIIAHFQNHPEYYDPNFSLEDYAIENFIGYFWWNFQIFETEN